MAFQKHIDIISNVACLQQPEQSLRNIYSIHSNIVSVPSHHLCVLKRFHSFSKLHYVYCHIGWSNIRVIPKLKNCDTVSIYFFNRKKNPMYQTWLTPDKKKRVKAICASPVDIPDGIITVKFSEKNRPFNWGLKGPLNKIVPNSSGEQPEGKVATRHEVIPITSPASVVDWMNSWIPNAR